MYVLKSLVLCCVLILLDLMYGVILEMGCQTLAFLEAMSFLVWSLVPRSLMFLYEGSGGDITGGSSQSTSGHHIILSPGSSSGGGGGGGGGRLSGASPSSVLDLLAKRLYFSSLRGVVSLM